MQAGSGNVSELGMLNEMKQETKREREIWSYDVKI
jgi:hypothetical protein